MIRFVVRLFLLLLPLAVLLYFAVPGWHRALTPAWFGLTRISPTLMIDDPARAAEVETMINRARAQSAAFFGPTGAAPVYLVCTTAPCARDFGIGAAGLAISSHRILIAPSGLTQSIIAHEQVHADHFTHMDVTDLWRMRFPAWFNEGLAAHLSGDTRYTLSETVEAADWIKEAKGYWDWRRLQTADSWRKTYGAAQTLVADIERRIGREGLQALVDAVGGGADFDTELPARLLAAAQ